MSTDLPATLARLETWLAEHVPAIHATLRPGASDMELGALEALIGQKLPEAFRTLYRWHDGQDWSAGFALGLEFLPLEGVRHGWEVWRDLEAEFQDSEDYASHPPGAIRTQYINLGWLGFLADGGGNFVGLDFDPGPAGTVGQVITFGRDQRDKFVLAESLGAFLREYLHRLESRLVSVERLEDFEEEMWSVELHNLYDPEIRYEGSEGTLASIYPGFVVSPKRDKR